MKYLVEFMIRRACAVITYRQQISVLITEGIFDLIEDRPQITRGIMAVPDG